MISSLFIFAPFSWTHSYIQPNKSDCLRFREGYSLKKIVVPRNTTIFLLFTVILFFGLLFIYTFNTIVIAGVVYLLLIPVSAFHFYSTLKSKKIEEIEDDIEHHEDVL